MIEFNRIEPPPVRVGAHRALKSASFPKSSIETFSASRSPKKSGGVVLSMM